MENFITISKAKAAMCAAAGTAGAALTALFGGWDKNLASLVIFMVMDYITGLIVAGVFHTSKKTESGTISSREGVKGFFRKLLILASVGIAFRLDLILETDGYIREFAIYGFMANELISIVENTVLMGVPWPEIIIKALDVLQTKSKTVDVEQSESIKHTIKVKRR